MKKIMLAGNLGFIMSVMNMKRFPYSISKENTEIVEAERGVLFSEKETFERKARIRISEKSKSKYHK